MKTYDEIYQFSQELSTVGDQLSTPDHLRPLITKAAKAVRDYASARAELNMEKATLKDRDIECDRYREILRVVRKEIDEIGYVPPEAWNAHWQKILRFIDSKLKG